MSERLDNLPHSNGIEEDPRGAYVYHDDVEPLIAELEAALAKRDRMLELVEEGVLRVLPTFSWTTAKLIRKVFAGVRARAGE